MPKRWTSWLTTHKAALVGAVVICVLVAFAAGLASEVLEDETLGFDQVTLHAMRDDHGAPIGPRWFERAMRDLSALGSTAVATATVLVACLALLFARRRVHALLVAACGVGTAVAVAVLKTIISRPRPVVIEALDTPGGFSFPSGHTLIAAALYPVLAYVIASASRQRALKRFAFAVAVVVALVVGFSRVYLGVHYPTDVVAGWSLGGAWAIACCMASGFFLRSTPAHDNAE